MDPSDYDQETSSSSITTSCAGQHPPKLFARQEQQQAILRIYKRHFGASTITDTRSDDKSELLLITGNSGTGKTALALTLQRIVHQDGGYFVSGKFDQLDRPESFYPFFQAITEFIQQVEERSSRGQQRPETRTQQQVKRMQEELSEPDNHQVEPIEKPIADQVEDGEGESRQSDNTLRAIRQALRNEPILLDLVPAFRRLLPCWNEQACLNDGSSTESTSRPLRSSCSSVSSASSACCNDSACIQRQHEQQQQQQELERPALAASRASRRRLLVAIIQFFRTVCSEQQGHPPVVLFLDDLQWADTTELALLAAFLEQNERPRRGKNSILDNNAHIGAIPGLLIMATSRPVEFDHNLSITLREMEASQVLIHDVSVQNFDKATIGAILYETLRSNSITTRQNGTREATQQAVDLAASFLWERTQGNVFFVRQFLLAIERGQASLEDMMDLDSSETAQQLVVGHIRQLSHQEQEVLTLAACLGAQFDVWILQRLFDYDVLPVLEEAERQGLLVHSSSTQHSFSMKSASGNAEYAPEVFRYACWRFAHDTVQWGTYSFLPEQERTSAHLCIGRRLCRELSDAQLLEALPIVANQFRHGAEGIKDDEEKDNVARICLRAGEQAASSSNFRAAASYFSTGISLLGNRHWRDQYHLSLDLFNAAAEVENCDGNRNRVDFLVGEVMTHARNFEDKIRAYTVGVNSLGSSSEVQKAVDLGLEVLCGLGIVFPRRISKRLVQTEYRKTKRKLGDHTPTTILELPRMTDAVPLAALRIMNILFVYALTARPLLGQLLPLRMVQMVLSGGISNMACVGFAGASMIVIPRFDDVEMGLRMSKISLSLLEKLQAREWLCRVYVSSYGYAYKWKYPFRSSLKPLLTAHRVGFGSGDVEFSLFAAVTYSRTAILLNPLPDAMEEMKAFVGLMRLHHQSNMIEFIGSTFDFALSLIGGYDQMPMTSEKDFTQDANEEGLKQLIEKKASSNHIAYFLQYKLMASYYFGNYKKAQEYSVLLDRKCRVDLYTAFSLSTLYLFQGLAALAPTNWSCCRPRVARSKLKKLKILAGGRKDSFWSKVCLLEAELLSFRGRLDEALVLYDSAVEYATKEGHLSEIGLTYERAALALQKRRGRHKEARQYWDMALKGYGQWGAAAKVKSMVRSMNILSTPKTSLMTSNDGTVPHIPEGDSRMSVLSAFGSGGVSGGANCSKRSLCSRRSQVSEASWIALDEGFAADTDNEDYDADDLPLHLSTGEGPPAVTNVADAAPVGASTTN